MRRLTLLLVVLLGWSQVDWMRVCGGQSAMSPDRPISVRVATTQAQTRVLARTLQPHPWAENQWQQGRESPIPTQAVGNQFANHVLATLERHVSVIARIRHRVHLGECSLRGSGRYWQQGVGNQRKTRLVLKTQLANQTASLIQVFDGRYLWTDRQLPSGRQVTRLDPVRMQASLPSGRSPMTRQGQPTSATTLLSTAASRGSFCGQLADLINQFDFGDPQSIRLNGSLRVALIGRWKAAELERVWPHGVTDLAEGIHSIDQGLTTRELLAHWPHQLPHHVLLLVGPQNLYPYFIEYRRAADAPLAKTLSGMQPVNDPLARYEQFEVQFAAQIDDRLFELAGRDIDWTDETAQRIKQLRTLAR